MLYVLLSLAQDQEEEEHQFNFTAAGADFSLLAFGEGHQQHDASVGYSARYQGGGDPMSPEGAAVAGMAGAKPRPAKFGLTVIDGSAAASRLPDLSSDVSSHNEESKTFHLQDSKRRSASVHDSSVGRGGAIPLGKSSSQVLQGT